MCLRKKDNIAYALCRIKAAGNDKNYYGYPNLNLKFPLNESLICIRYLLYTQYYYVQSSKSPPVYDLETAK